MTLSATTALQFLRLADNEFPLPSYQTSGSVGFDLQVHLPRTVIQNQISFSPDRPLGWVLTPQDTVILATGWAVAIPVGYELQIRPRSGLAIRHQLIILNSPGTIDADYRGEILIGVKNLSTIPLGISHGMRIAQAVMAPVMRAELIEVSTLPDTDRGTGGLGSTGT